MSGRANAITIAEINRAIERARRSNPVRCTIASHEAMKQKLPKWMAGTDRLPHRPNGETIVGGLWYRNCRECRSTLAIEVAE